jgi:NAD(P)-dependent dehydrogenase (short-subunit alcohol dehydrogenase family)
MVEDWKMSVALGRAGRPEELGELFAFLLSGRAGYTTGAVINCDGGTQF